MTDTVFVRKKADGSVQIVSNGETVKLEDGTAIPYGNLATYSAGELSAFAIFSFSPPQPPSGQQLVSVDYVATENGVDQVPVFEPIPPPPFVSQADAVAMTSYRASLRRKAHRYAARGNISKSVSLLLQSAGVLQ